MDVAVDEAGQGEASADIDFGGLASERRFDGGDPAARDADVHRVGGTTQQGVAKDEVEGGLGGHGSCGRNLVHSAAFGGSRLSAVLRRKCQKYSHLSPESGVSIPQAREIEPCPLPQEPKPVRRPTPRSLKPISQRR